LPVPRAGAGRPTGPWRDRICANRARAWYGRIGRGTIAAMLDTLTLDGAWDLRWSDAQRGPRATNYDPA